jgi:hypothetical protein
MAPKNKIINQKATISANYQELIKHLKYFIFSLIFSHKKLLLQQLNNPK